VPAEHDIGAAVPGVADHLGIVVQIGQAIAAVLAAGQVHGDRPDPAGFKQFDGVRPDPRPEESAVDQLGRDAAGLAVGHGASKCGAAGRQARQPASVQSRTARLEPAAALL
jgi:hypothetical protein